jgi:WD40 repeat protein
VTTGAHAPPSLYTTSSYATSRAPSTLDRENPWPGLDSFREADGAFFTGRVEETRQLLRLVGRERLTVLFGRSGLGKSSLLQAGLFPLLRKEGMLPIYVRPAHTEGAPPARQQVLEAIARAAAEHPADAPPADPEQTLWEYFHREGEGFWTADNQLLTPVLVFDQFEEVFTVGAHPERAERTQAFLEELGDLIEGRVPRAVRARIDTGGVERGDFTYGEHGYKVVLSLRADFVSELELLRPRIPSVAGNRMRLGPLTGERALDVTAAGGRTLVPREVGERIVRLVAGEADDDQRDGGAARAPLGDLVIEPTLLSLFCRELNEWRKRKGKESITADLVAGSRSAILSGFYERSVRDLDRRVRAFVEDRLLTVGGYRNSVAEEDARALPAVTPEVLDTLVDRRLIRREERGGHTWLELTHDVLTGVVRESAKARHAEEALARAHAESEAQQRALLDARRRTRGAFLLAAVALAAAVVAGFQWWQLRAARQLVARSEFRSAAQLVEAGDPQAALAWLASSITRDPDFQSSRALALQLLSSSNELPTVLLPDSSTFDAAFAPDGRHVVVAGRGDTRLEVLAVDGSGERRALPGHPEPINSIRFSRDGTRMITASGDGTVRLWDARTWAVLDSLPHGSPVHEAMFSPDGAWITTVASDSVARLWRSDGSGAPLLLDGGGHGIADVAFSPDGQYVLGAALDGAVVEWRLGERRPRRVRRSQGEPLFTIDAGSDSASWFVTGARDGSVYVWAAADTGAPRATLHGHEGAVLDVAVGPSGGRMATTASDGTVRLWDVRTGASLGPALRSGELVWRVGFSADGNRLVTASSDGTRLWEVPWRLPASRRVPEGVGGVIGLSPNGRQMVTSAHDESGRLWLLDGSGPPVELHEPDGMHSYWALFSDGGDRFVTIMNDGDSTQRFRVWSAAERKPVGSMLAVPGRSSDTYVTLSANGRLLAVSGADSTAWVWTVDGGRGVTKLRSDGGRMLDVSFSPDGRRVATVSSDSTIRVWDVAAGRMLATQQVAIGELHVVMFAPDGKSLATGSMDGTVRLWRDNLKGGALVLHGHEGAVSGLVFDSAGRRLASWAPDNAVRLWDTETGVSLGPPLRHDGAIQSVAFTPEGQQVVTIPAASSTSRAPEPRAWRTWTSARADAEAIAALAVGAAHGKLDPKTGAIVPHARQQALAAFRAARARAERATSPAPGSFDAFLRWYFGLSEGAPPAVSRTARADPPSRTRRP